MLSPFGDAGDQDLDGRLDDPVRVELSGAGPAQGVAQAAKRLVDQNQTERFHRLEMTIKRRGHNPDFPGHLAQAQAAQAALLQELEGGGDDGAPGGLFALLA